MGVFLSSHEIKAPTTAPVHRLQAEYILALLTCAMGLVNLVSAVTPALRERLLLIENLFPLQVRSGTRLGTALAGFALLVLASGIWRGKRTAWLVTLLTLLASLVGHLVKGLDLEEASLAAALILALVLFRSRFQAASDAPTARHGLRILGIAFLFTLVYGTAGFYILDRHFTVRFNLFQAAAQTVRMFTSFSDPGLAATTRFGRYFADSIYLVAAGTLGYALLALLAPVLVRRTPELNEREQAARLVEAYGRTVLARFCLLGDKQYFFSPGGSLIAYTYARRTAVVLGDPIGPESDLLPAVLAFQEFCRHNDWQPTFYQTRADTLPDYQAAGMRALKIGVEALIRVQDFSLKGPAMKPVRNAVTRVERLGFNARTSKPPHDANFLKELKQISDAWLAGRGGKEMKFSMGWFDLDYLNTTTIISLQDASGKIAAFANLVEADGGRETAVDLMRHAVDAPSGTMDALFAGLLQEAQNRGCERFNMGLSGLAGVGESSDDPSIERALHFIYTHVHTAYNFKGLHSFKQKFNPAWSPRYLIYPGLANLPMVAVAVSDVSS